MQDEIVIHAAAITSLTDARYFASKLEVAYLGFHLEPSAPQHLDPAYMKAIHEWVQGPILTGWFFDSTIEDVLESMRFFALGAVVVHQEMVHRYGAELLAGTNWHLCVVPDKRTQTCNIDVLILAQQNEAKSIIIDLRGWSVPEVKAVMTGAAWFGEICRRRPTILYCNDLTYTELETYTMLAPLAGFCIAGSTEERVGVKAYDTLEDLFDQLESR
jgi:phosphoribosylanthranilate isomerase